MGAGNPCCLAQLDDEPTFPFVDVIDTAAVSVDCCALPT
jgi:hypothetical protein